MNQNGRSRSSGIVGHDAPEYPLTMYGRVFIVQDRESAQFLRPDAGDVGFTLWIDKAGFFESEDEATETASNHCSEGFLIFSFFKRLSS
jgi:hypothetical protein